jgi:NADH-quinone oxidoreductase subunit L
MAVLAIAGFPPLAGFFSKDAILYSAFLQGPGGMLLWFVGLVTALLTSLYMFRLWYMTFMGESRSPEIHPHESPWSMLSPLVILALLSIGGGWIGIERFSTFLTPATGARVAESATPHLELYLTAAAVAVALLGWLIAYRFYGQKTNRPAELANAMPGAYTLLANKYYVDEIYGATIVKPLLGFSKFVLGWVVDVGILGGIVWMLSGIAVFTGAVLQRWQSGNLRSYAAWLALGAAAILLFISAPSMLGAAGVNIHLNWMGW